MASIRIDYIQKNKYNCKKDEYIALTNKCFVYKNTIMVYGYVFVMNFIGDLEYICGKYYDVRALMGSDAFIKCYDKRGKDMYFLLADTNDIMGLEYGMEIKDDGGYYFDYANIE